MNTEKVEQSIPEETPFIPCRKVPEDRMADNAEEVVGRNLRRKQYSDE
jgi:hypothetical protein